jgi:uncharacterized membrane protein
MMRRLRGAASVTRVDVDRADADFGPLQLLTVAFDGNRFKGEILPELERLKERGIVRIVDLLAVRKDAHGAVGTLTATDLEWEEATRFGSYIGTLVGLGAGGAEGAARGAIAGAAELADGHLFDTEDAERLISIVPNGMTIAVLLLEHLWLLPLLQAIERANGFELKNDWVGLDSLIAVGIQTATDDAGN